MKFYIINRYNIKYIFIIFISIILLSTKFQDENKEHYEYFNLNEDSKNRTLLFEKYNEYLNICRNGMLINNINNNQFLPPKISAIIPVYNANQTIKSALRSIQNQNMNEIEIILVDDYSSDNSISIINQLMSEDKRIKLIKNKKNHGTFYSRSIGAINAKGKYIMALDNDDIFLYGIFEKCYREAKRNNIDIIEFSGLQICNNCTINLNKIYIPYYLRFKEENLMIYQPNLSNFFYNKINDTYLYDFKDVFVWGKLIKTKIYHSALELLGKEIFQYNIYLTEDKILTVSLFKVAKSFKFINIYGIIYFENPNSICHSLTITKRKSTIADFLLFSIVFFKLTKNSEEVQLVMEDFKIRFNEYCDTLENKYIKLLIKLYNDILKCTYIKDKDKKYLLNLININKKKLVLKL